MACSLRPGSATPTPRGCWPPPKQPGGPLQYLAPGSPPTAARPARAASQARQILGEDRFTQAWEEGRGLTLDDAVAYAARKGGGRKRPAAGWASLTPAELEVARLVGEGLRNEAIARRLFIAPGTVKVHVSHIFAKLGITTRAELAAQAALQDVTVRSSDGLAPAPCRSGVIRPDALNRCSVGHGSGDRHGYEAPESARSISQEWRLVRGYLA